MGINIQIDYATTQFCHFKVLIYPIIGISRKNHTKQFVRYIADEMIAAMFPTASVLRSFSADENRIAQAISVRISEKKKIRWPET